MSTWTENPTDERPSGRHPVNVGHLVMGLALLGLVAIWAIVQADVVTGDEIRWLLPIPWVVAGAAGLIAVAITGTRRYGVRRTGWVGNDAPAQDTVAMAEEPTDDIVTENTETTETPEENR